jgi:hypothetical protein
VLWDGHLTVFRRGILVFERLDHEGRARHALRHGTWHMPGAHVCSNVRTLPLLMPIHVDTSHLTCQGISRRSYFVKTGDLALHYGMDVRWLSDRDVLVLERLDLEGRVRHGGNLLERRRVVFCSPWAAVSRTEVQSLSATVWATVSSSQQQSAAVSSSLSKSCSQPPWGVRPRMGSIQHFCILM